MELLDVARLAQLLSEARDQLAHQEMEIDYARLEAAHFLRVHMPRVCTTFERGCGALSACAGGGAKPELLSLAERCARELLADRPRYAAPMGYHVLACSTRSRANANAPWSCSTSPSLA